ncbi:MAG: YggS family pyridoxal phosphate-dependent enzyme [Clostridia bacterium]|nr:YggS family pyridoxal phosphate-dependent enzyme [Clostridia bacterium]
MSEFNYIKKNCDELLAEIAEMAKRLGRAPAEMVAVTKSGSDEEFLALLACGIGDFAENRPAELKRRAALAKEQGYDIRAHQIGSLQRNKVKLVIPEASLIHSVDSLRLAEEIDRRAEKLGTVAAVLIEVNSGEEENKGGVLPKDAEALFLEVKGLSHVSVKGIMTMGPDDDGIREAFRRTKEIFDCISEKYGFDTDSPILSMGMSESYKEAIEEGATMVRIGRRLFKKEN